MKCSLGISDFLEEIPSLSHSVVFLYFFALIAEEGFLISSWYSLEFCIQMLICFLFSFAFHFSTNKASGGDRIPVELFQILKDDAVKVLHSICSKFGKLSSGHRTGKGQFSFQSQRKAMPKNIQTTAQLYSSHTLVK